MKLFINVEIILIKQFNLLSLKDQLDFFIIVNFVYHNCKGFPYNSLSLIENELSILFPSLCEYRYL